MKPRASIIIRCKNEVVDIGGVLCAIRSQQVDFPFEVIAVDSGSTDGTLDVLRHFDVRIIEIPAESFTFGYALNVGCAAAEGDILIALSAHVYPKDRGWLARHVGYFDDDRVAATATGRVFLRQDLAGFESNPYVGCDNANGGFPAALWRQRPFDETLSGTEDKEWGHHFQRQGYLVICDPQLMALHIHPADSAADMMRERYWRACREHMGYAAFLSRTVLFKALIRRFLKRPPMNRESLAWYVGAVRGILAPPQKKTSKREGQEGAGA
ncbi:MAG: glycosyltransferase [Leptospirillia bacterium]